MTGTEPAEAADLELVRLAQAGDLGAFGTLVERHRRAVYRAAVAALGSATEADDAAQDAFVTAFRKLNGFRGDSSFRTWLLAIAWRKALDRRRRVVRWIRLAVTPAPEAGTPNPVERAASSERSPEQRLLAAELQQRVRRLVATLPGKLRDPLLLAGSGEYSYEEIGRMLDVPVGTIKWRIAEARRLLKRKLGHGPRTETSRERTRMNTSHGRTRMDTDQCANDRPRT